MKLTVTFLLIFSYLANSQEGSNLDELSQIKELYEMSKGKYDSLSFTNHHKILFLSKKIAHKLSELEAYKSLAWYHGNGHDKKRRLDSTLHYFQLFEAKISVLKSSDYQKIISQHYLNKINILSNRFGLLEEALIAYNEGYKFLDNEDVNLQTYYDVLIAQIYKSKNNHKKAITYLEPRLKDTLLLTLPHKLYLLQNLASLYRMEKAPKKSLSLNNKLLEIAKANQDDYYLWWTKKEMCYDYFLLGKTDKAIDSALTIRNYYKMNFNIDALIDISVYLGEFFYAKGALDKAIQYQEEALGMEYNINDLPEKYGVLANFYSEKKNYVKAQHYYKRKDEINDSLRLAEQKLYTLYADTNVKFVKEQKLNDKISNENEILEKKNNRQRNSIVTLCILLLTALLVVFYYFFRKKKNKEQQVLKELKTKEQQSILEEQVKLRDEELKISSKTISSNISSLNQLKKELEKGNLSDPEKIKKTSKEISSLITSSSNSTIITDKLTSKYPDLALLLKTRYPNLSEREIEYCLLTKLNLSVKETAIMLNVSPGTVKVARSRLKTKMKIPQEMTFKEYLNTLS